MAAVSTTDRAGAQVHPALTEIITRARETNSSLRAICDDPRYVHTAAAALYEVASGLVGRMTVPAFVDRSDLVCEGVAGMWAVIDRVDMSLDTGQIARFVIDAAKHGIVDYQRRVSPLTRSQAAAVKATAAAEAEAAARKARTQGSGFLTLAERFELAKHASHNPDRRTQLVSVYGLDSIGALQPDVAESAETTVESTFSASILHLAVAVASADHPDCPICAAAAESLITPDATTPVNVRHHPHLHAAITQLEAW